jgi:hypothetical protein
MVARVGQVWDWHWSPFSVMRKTGYYGANRLLSGWVRRRLMLENE